MLLLEPSRWQFVQQKVSVQDFKDPVRQKLAEIYWEHQRHEGEPVINEFLGQLRDPALVELSVKVIDEVELLAEIDQTLTEALAHLERMRKHRDDQKLVAEIRRPDEHRDEQGGIDLLRQIQENARKPNLRRV